MFIDTHLRNWIAALGISSVALANASDGRRRSDHSGDSCTRRRTPGNSDHKRDEGKNNGERASIE